METVLQWLDKLNNSIVMSSSRGNKKNKNEVKQENEEKVDLVWKYELTNASGCDITIRRTKGKSSEILALISSAKTYIIIDEVKKEAGKPNAIKELTENSLKNFFKDLVEPIKIENGCFFAKTISDANTKSLWNTFCLINRDQLAHYLAKKGYLRAGVNTSRYQLIVEHHPKLLDYIVSLSGENKDGFLSQTSSRMRDRESCLITSLPELTVFAEIFGIEWAKKLAYELYVSDIAVSNNADRISDGLETILWYMFQERANRNQRHWTSISTSFFGENKKMQTNFFKAQNLIEYLTRNCTYQGYAMSFSRFCDEYIDTLNMQELLFGKIKDKYPDQLAFVHQRLSYLASLKENELNEKAWNCSYEINKKLDFEGKEYFIRAFKTPGEVLDEAAQQRNCLAGYISKIQDGHSKIYAMRLKKKPDESLVSIEVIGNKINQAYRAGNQPITEDDSDFIKKWAKEMELIYN